MAAMDEAIRATCSFLSYFFFLFLASAALSEANIADFDETWQKREEVAKAMSRAAYVPKPETITNSFNDAVARDLMDTKDRTRRMMIGKAAKGELCYALNPIDRCWRCRHNWHHHRKLLATCAKGFGYQAMGGIRGDYYVVTDPSDDDVMNPKPGTLRHAVIQTEPLWIVFERDMTIELSQELMITSYKTIDGRGAQVHIAQGAGLTMQFVTNVIIHNLNIHDIVVKDGGMIRDSVTHYGIRGRSDGDGMSIFGSSKIWVDHVSMSQCMDGLIDVVRESTAVTISNSHFTNHNDVMLFGNEDRNSGDASMQVTVAFNNFGQNLVQRMPRVRWGFAHVVNNDYNMWRMYAIGGSQHPTIISDGNRFNAPDDPNLKEVTKRECNSDGSCWNWMWTSVGDELRNGATFNTSGPPNAEKFRTDAMFAAKPGTYVTRLTRYSGTLACKPFIPC